MPIYEYNCIKCHKHFEIVQKITDAPTAKCPKCGNPSKRIISQTSFTLKGGGWYKDGYTKKQSTENKTPKTETKKTKEK